MTKRQLRKQLKEFSHKTEPSTTLYSGALGIYIGGHQYVDVPNRPGFVYVRLRNNTSELIQAHNEVVSPVYGLPVILVRNKTYYEIYGRDSVQYASYWDTNSSYLPKHGSQHEFDPDNNGGGDLVFVHGEQFYPMMTFPSGTDGGNTVLIAPYRYYYSSAWHYAGDTGAGNLLQYGPTGASNAKLLLVGIDATTGNPFVKLGSEFDASITGAAALTSYVPTNITQSTEIPGAIVRLVTGTSTITWANIYDARQYMGILQSQASTFLALTDTPSSYSGQANKIVSVKADETGLEFVVASTGTNGGGGGGSNLVIYDDSVFKVTGTAISFDSNLSVVVTGSVAYISSTATGTSSSGGRTLIQVNTPVGVTGTYFDVPSTYGNLEVVWVASGEQNAGDVLLSMFFNDDLVIGNYREERLSATSTTVAGISLSNCEVGRISAITTTGSAGSGNIYIPYYNNNYFNKTATALLGWKSTVSAIGLRSYFLEWQDKSPITRIAFGIDTGNFATGTVFYLYGENGTVGGGAGATTFLGLTDTPSSYSGQADKIVAVNSAGNALEFRTNTGSFGNGGGTTLGLGFYGQDEGVGLGTGTTLNVVGSDISLSISGTVLTLLHSDPTGTPYSFLDLTDTPDTYSGQGSKFVAVKSDASGLEFVNSPGGIGGSGLVIYDDSVYKVTGTSISFDNNLSVIISGSTAFVSASGASGLNNSNLALTVSGTTTAAVNTRYFIDIGGLVGDRYFVLPTGTTIGDQIELYLVTGSATYELIVRGDTGVSINGGATATEWSRVFINQETLKFVANSIANWEVTYDGRIPCIGRLERITTPYVTGSADTWTLPDWNNIGLNIGNITNLAQDRFDIRRAGYYVPSGNYAPGAAITADNYCAASIWQNTTQVSTALNRPSVTSSLATVPLPAIPFYANVNDYFEYRFATQQANKGMGRTDDASTAPTKVGWVYFSITELLRGA